MRWLAVAVLAAVCALAFVDAGPPSPVAADAPPGVFSAERAMGTVSELATEPRPVGSPASDRVREELVRRLEAAGLRTEVQPAVGASVRSGAMNAGAVENVVARLPGTAPTGTVVLAAHYDSVAHGPGAADDTSSVAAILEAVRALRTVPALRNDLVVLITDGEEAGLLGARAWARDSLVPDRRPTVTVNFEARGMQGPSLMFQTSWGDAGLVDAFVDAVPHPTGDSSLVEFYRLLPNETDLTAVLDAGRPGLNFAFIERPVDYHTAQDSPANVDPGSVQGHGDAALGLARTLGERDLAPLDPAVSGAEPSGDRTYFRFLGAAVTYPGWLVVPVAVVAALVGLGAAALGVRRRVCGVGGTLVAAGATLVAAAVGLVGCIGLWSALVALRPSYADTGPFLARPLLFQLAAAALAVAVAAAWLLALRRRPGRFASAAGACLVLGAAGVATAFALPGLSFLFALPALGVGVGLAAAVVNSPPSGARDTRTERGRHVPSPPSGARDTRTERGRHVLGRRAATAVVTVGAVPAVVLLVPLGWELFSVAGLSDGLPVLVLVLALTALSVVLLPGPDASTLPSGAKPVAGPARVPGSARVSGVALVSGLVLVVAFSAAGLLVDRPSAERPQSSSLSFVQDADAGTAVWASADDAPADWTGRYVGSPPAPLPGWTTDAAVRTGPARPLPVPGPAVTVLERSPAGVTVQVASPRGAPTVLLDADRSLRSVAVAYPGRAPATGSSVDGPIRLVAVPSGGVRVTLAPATPGPVRLRVSDISDGLVAVPGFVPRPPDLREAPDRSSDQVVVTRAVTP